ncbi:MAG: hypothetical protein HOE48_03635 [Candidatus Latescibacteria bacterium]|nr:hypothetical protein [Candidatus Latescibacterota bacterium]
MSVFVGYPTNTNKPDVYAVPWFISPYSFALSGRQTHNNGFTHPPEPNRPQPAKESLAGP